MTPSSKKKATANKVSTKKVSGNKVIKKKVVKAQPKTEAKAMSGKIVTPKVEKKTSKTSSKEAPAITIAPEERWMMIANAAYLKAEKRGFAPGGEQQDWIEAEKEIDQLIKG